METSDIQKFHPHFFYDCPWVLGYGGFIQKGVLSLLLFGELVVSFAAAIFP